MNTERSLMIVGVGDLAGLVLDMLTRVPRFGKIYLAGRNMEHMTQRKNLCLLVANQLGYYPDMECIPLNLMQIDKSAETIAQYKPDVIFNSATFQSWRIITYLPKEVFKEIDQAQFGPWLPMHLTPVYKLMQAVKASGTDAKVVNAAFPDAVCPVLSKIGLNPTIGIGNAANVIPTLRGAVALKFKVPVEEIEVSLCTQHYFSHRIPAYGDAGGSPYYFQARVNGTDVRDQYTDDEIFQSVATDFKKFGGAFRQMITASSAVSVLLPMLLDSGQRTHAPGPNGLPGGYPVTVNFDKVSVVLPDDITLEKAIEINNDCQRFDGIDKIDDDGTVHFTEQEMAIMKKMLGYECLTMPLAECEARSEELGQKFQAFRKQFS